VRYVHTPQTAAAGILEHDNQRRRARLPFAMSRAAVRLRCSHHPAWKLKPCPHQLPAGRSRRTEIVRPHRRSASGARRPARQGRIYLDRGKRPALPPPHRSRIKPAPNEARRAVCCSAAIETTDGFRNERQRRKAPAIAESGRVAICGFSQFVRHSLACCPKTSRPPCSPIRRAATETGRPIPTLAAQSRQKGSSPASRFQSFECHLHSRLDCRS